MSPKQEPLYWREWGVVRIALRKLGHKKPDGELRHWLTIQALGADKSHKFFNNHDFDRWLAVARGYTLMGDLDEQLRLIAQPLARCMFACRSLLVKCAIEEHGQEAYVRAIYQRVQARRSHAYDLDDIPDEDLPLILAALTHTAEHKGKTGHAHPRSRTGRAAYDHRVGSRTPATTEEAPASPRTSTSDEPAYHGPSTPDEPF
jgi:hypothetical protein